MTNEEALLKYVLRLGDNALVLAQRLIELAAHGPELEEELATANFALDYLGQARMFYTYAGELEGKGRSEDDFAFMRPEREFCNLQLVEQPNGHFGDVTVRSVLFDAFYLLQLACLEKCSDQRLTEIAARAMKEVRYHHRYNSQWLIRLGDGTDESHRRVQASIDNIWQYTGEMFAGDAVDEIFRDHYDGPDLNALQAEWRVDVAAVVQEATVRMPADAWMSDGGREGIHTEHFGSLIAEMQTMQRSYPGLSW